MSDKPVKALNVYGRLQKVRAEVQGSGLKKTGSNQGREYFELADFLPKVTEQCNTQGIMPLFTLKKDMAVLRVINVDDAKDSVTFYIPTANATVPQAQMIQNLGAQITYMKRYLYMIAFEIAEADAIDKIAPEENEKIAKKQAVAAVPAVNSSGEKMIIDSQRDVISRLENIAPEDVPVMTFQQAADKIRELATPKKKEVKNAA
jgi:hypothetical protein